MVTDRRQSQVDLPSKPLANSNNAGVTTSRAAPGPTGTVRLCRPMRRRARKAKPAFDGPRIVAAKKLGLKQRPVREIDPEEQARLDAFFARMMRPRDHTA